MGWDKSGGSTIIFRESFIFCRITSPCLVIYAPKEPMIDWELCGVPSLCTVNIDWAAFVFLFSLECFFALTGVMLIVVRSCFLFSAWYRSVLVLPSFISCSMGEGSAQKCVCIRNFCVWVWLLRLDCSYGIQSFI